jgi:hypothetical protein
MQDYGAPTQKTVNVWHVVRIEDQTAFTSGKGAVRVKRVYWQLFDGTESYEDFPAATFDLGKAEAAIDKAAQLMYQALQLKGPEIQVSAS